MNTIRIKRVYEPSSEEDGFRILVDRLWPRGISKERANVDEWAKYIAPSTELRREFYLNPKLIDAFKHKYVIELDSSKDALEFTDKIRRKLEADPVTFLFASKNEEMNHAIILKEWLEKHM